MVPDMTVLGMRSLGQVVAELRGEQVPEAPPVAPMSGSRLLTWRGEERLEEVDLADVLGMEDARYAVEVAAAGGHHLLLSGPKGCGKTTLAERIPTILPDLTPEESLELTALHSLAGALAGRRRADPTAAVLGAPPRRQQGQHPRRRHRPGPAGRGQPRPLRRAVPRRVPAVPHRRHRQRCASRSRAARSPSPAATSRSPSPPAAWSCSRPTRAPAATTTPTPGSNRCTCREKQRRDYRHRVRGPITDRIDITRHLEPLRPHDAHDRWSPARVLGRRSASGSRRRASARRARYARRGWRLNGQAPGPVLARSGRCRARRSAWSTTRMYAGQLSRRGATRVHRLAWTVADLRGAATPRPSTTPTPRCGCGQASRCSPRSLRERRTAS